MVIGFLNVFLWSANLWFLYKETRWFAPNTGKCALEMLLLSNTSKAIKNRDEDPDPFESVDFGHPDPRLFPSDLDPTCNNGYMIFF